MPDSVRVVKDSCGGVAEQQIFAVLHRRRRNTVGDGQNLCAARKGIFGNGNGSGIPHDGGKYNISIIIHLLNLTVTSRRAGDPARACRPGRLPGCALLGPVRFCRYLIVDVVPLEQTGEVFRLLVVGQIVSHYLTDVEIVGPCECFGWRL